MHCLFVFQGGCFGYNKEKLTFLAAKVLLSTVDLANCTIERYDTAGLVSSGG